MDHLKFVETLESKEIEKDNIIIAQIYAQTNMVFNKNSYSLN